MDTPFVYLHFSPFPFKNKGGKVLRFSYAGQDLPQILLHREMGDADFGEAFASDPVPQFQVKAGGSLAGMEGNFAAAVLF